MVNQPAGGWQPRCLTPAWGIPRLCFMVGRLGAGNRVIAALAMMTLPAMLPAAPGDAPPQPVQQTRALIVVRTLVIDAMGTRTVATDRARVPFGTRGLLVRSVPYAGPAMAFRLAARPASPTPQGIPLEVEAEVWSGDASNPPTGEALARRSEQTTLAAEGSFLLELEHDEKARRRVVLSISARPIGEDEALPDEPQGSTLRSVGIHMQIIRQAGPTADEPITHSLTTVMGRSVSYSFTVRRGTGARADGETQTVGGTIEVTPESWQGDLVTIRTEMTGAEYLDELRSRIEPFRLSAVRTVRSGQPLDLYLTVPADPAALPEGGRPVTYSIIIIPAME